MDALSGAIPSHLMADPSKDLPKAKNAMGKEDFMKLLMTQLQNQDPLKPLDPTQTVTPKGYRGTAYGFRRRVETFGTQYDWQKGSSDWKSIGSC